MKFYDFIISEVKPMCALDGSDAIVWGHDELMRGKLFIESCTG